MIVYKRYHTIKGILAVRIEFFLYQKLPIFDVLY